MRDDFKISSTQLAALVFTFIIATATLYIPALLSQKAGQDAWIAVIVAGVVGIFIALIVTSLGGRFPEQTLVEYSQVILGTWIGKLVGLVYIWFYIHLTSIVLREVAETAVGTLLPRTPLEVVAIVIVVSCAYAVKAGIEVVARVNILSVLINFIIMATVLLLIVRELNVEYLTPVLSGGVAPVLRASITPIGWFGEVVSVAFLIPFLNRSREAKGAALWGVIATTIILMLIVMVTLMLFGPHLTSILTFPTLKVIRLINLADFIQRIEVIFLVPWIMANYIKICVFYYIAVQIIAQWLKAEYGPLVFPVGIIITTLAIGLFENRIQLNEFLDKVWGVYALPFELGIPILLLVLAVLRKKGEAGNG